MKPWNLYSFDQTLKRRNTKVHYIINVIRYNCSVCFSFLSNCRRLFHQNTLTHLTLWRQRPSPAWRLCLWRASARCRPPWTSFDVRRLQVERWTAPYTWRRPTTSADCCCTTTPPICRWAQSLWSAPKHKWHNS